MIVQSWAQITSVEWREGKIEKEERLLHFRFPKICDCERVGTRQGLPLPRRISSLLLVSKAVSLTCAVTILDKEQLQWNLSFETPQFRGHKIWSRKNVHLIVVFVTSIEGTPLFRGKGHLFWVLKPGFNLHSGDTLALEKVTDPKKRW